MRVNTPLAIPLMILVVAGCGAAPVVESVDEPTPAGEKVPVSTEPVATLLDHPFSAEQIRDEWVEGFRLKVRRWTAGAEAFEEWTVVRADGETVDIEAVVRDADGTEVAEPSIRTSTWVQLRDHASFPADRATREPATRETPLGELEGWLYTVGEPSGEVVTEFFFAEDHPGAPVTVHVVKNGELVEVFEQIERHEP
jgi:hypothetical protein